MGGYDPYQDKLGNQYKPLRSELREKDFFSTEDLLHRDKRSLDHDVLPDTSRMKNLFHELNTQPREIPVPHVARFIRIMVHHNSVESFENTLDIPSLIRNIRSKEAAKATRVTFSANELFVVDDLDIPFELKHPRESLRRLALTGAVNLRNNGLSTDEDLDGATVWCISISPRSDYSYPL